MATLCFSFSLLLLSLCCILWFLALSSSFKTIPEEEDDTSISRDIFHLAANSEDVVWVVQVSDLHVSSYHPERSEDLKRLLVPALRVIRPNLVLITGDLTDAKNKERTSTRQDELEWIQYRNTMDAVIIESGIDRRAFFDIRGNHDKYGVPHVGNKLDFFSNYSISSQLNRSSTIQSISLMGKDWNFIFLGIDDSMRIGLRGPSNLFGHPSDRKIETVELELESRDAHPGALVTKVVFGHFPMSFTASSETGKRYESVFARQSVSAYLCGHLHAKFSKRLWRHHSIELEYDGKNPKSFGQFWEWELGDWKESRLMRILAVDGGQVSFLDIELLTKHGSEWDFAAAILITYPVDSRIMNTINLDNYVLRNDISALVFSAKPILNVTATIFDSSRSFQPVEEVALHSTSIADRWPLFRAKWNARKYINAPATRFWLRVLVVDSDGVETMSTLRPFSIDGKLAGLPKTWLAYLVFHLRWETLYSVLLWSNIGFLIILLFLPKLLNFFMEKNTHYQRWAMSVSVSSSIGQRRIFFLPLWFLIEGSCNRTLWSSMVLYLLYLLVFPWFWGYATEESGPIASMSMHGWTVQSLGMPLSKVALGVPDIIVITVPFMYLIITPLFLLIYSLYAERSAFHLHSSSKSRCSEEPNYLKPNMEYEVQPVDGTSAQPSKGMKKSLCKICEGWARTVLVLGCLVILFVHFRQCSSLMAAYGVFSVVISPGLSWAPPLLLAAAVYSTQSPIRNHVKL